MTSASLPESHNAQAASSGIPVVIAADNAEFRARLVGILERAGIAPAKAGNSSLVYRLEPEIIDEAIIVLDTDDNVVRLVQSVNDLYRNPFSRTGGSGVLCVVSGEAFDRNQQLCWWLIDGHAAVFAVWCRDSHDWERFPAVPRRLAMGHSQSPPLPSRPNLDALCERLRCDGADASAWLDLATLVLDYNGVHQARHSVGAAAARQAALLDPTSAPAHAALGRALLYLGRYDEAAPAFREAIRLSPGLVQAHQSLAEILYRQGHKAVARREFETVIRLDPEGRAGYYAKQALENWRW